MSVVTGVTLHLSCTEDCSGSFLGKDVVPNVQQIAAWLRQRHFGPLVPVDRHFGGSKHPQVLVYGAGYNYFPEDEFAAFILSLEWRDPENVVLLLNPEEGGTRVFRP